MGVSVVSAGPVGTVLGHGRRRLIPRPAPEEEEGEEKSNKRSMREWMKKRGRRKGGEEYDYCEGEEEEEEGEL